MARINIEDSIFKDPRFINYCIKKGDQNLALGCLVNFWIIAQKFFLSHGEIPNEEFIKYYLDETIIMVGLAERTQTGVKAKGQNKEFAWLASKKKAGSAGGKKSAENRKTKYGTAQPKLEASASKTPKQTRSKTKHTEASFLSSHSSLLFNNLLSKENLKNNESEVTTPSFEGEATGINHPVEEKQKAAVHVLRDSFCQAYKKRYGVNSNPVITSYHYARMKQLLKETSLERACALISHYCEMNEKFFIERSHDLTFFFSSLQNISNSLTGTKKTNSVWDWKPPELRVEK